MPKKITLIGAGSVVFAKNLLGDILQFPALANSEICLMDIDPDRLKVAEVMAKKMVAKLGVGAKVSATTSRRKAIKGARYVICTIQVGGYKPGTVIDFEIPKRYGLEQTIGDTLGIGGIFRALRTIPELTKIAQDIADVAAPDCLLLNYSNPMAMNCMAIDRAVGIPHVGLCHSVQGTSKELAGYAGLPYEDVSYLVAGINHMAFFLKFEYKGQDAYPLLFKTMDDPQIYALNKVRFEMMRRTGYFVTESSEHQAEYVPYFIHHGKEMIDQFDIPIDEYLRRCEAIIATWEETEKSLLGANGEMEIKPRTHEYGSYIINARETGDPTVVYGNVPNRDLISNLPQDCCVELPCLVDKNGVQPTRIGNLPTQLAAICRTNINVQELAVDAALTGKREAVYHAAMLDPHTAASLPLDKIWAMCDDLIEAHQKAGLLGEYSDVLKNTGRSFAGIGDRIIAKLEVSGALKTAAKEKNTLALKVENPTDSALNLSFQLDAGDAPVAIEKGRSVKLQIPPGKNKTAKIRMTNRSEITTAFDIGLSTKDAQILCQDAQARPRGIVPASNGELSFELELDGNPAVEGSLQKLKSGLKLKAKVNDSLITEPTRRMSGWNGSRVELHVAADSKSPIATLCVVPSSNSGKPRVVDTNLNPLPAKGLKQRSTEMHYTIEATFDYATLGIKPDTQRFLFDVACGLGALGDAHSGGNTSLSGEFKFARDSSRFLEARFR